MAASGGGRRGAGENREALVGARAFDRPPPRAPCARVYARQSFQRLKCVPAQPFAGASPRRNSPLHGPGIAPSANEVFRLIDPPPPHLQAVGPPAISESVLSECNSLRRHSRVAPLLLTPKSNRPPAL